MARDNLGSRELALLSDGLSDDVSFLWALIHLGIRANPPAVDGPPNEEDVAAAFECFQRLVEAGLVEVGRLEYVDRGPPGRVAPTRHVPEPLELVRARVQQACRASSRDGGWENSCWLVNTAKGDEVARRAASA